MKPHTRLLAFFILHYFLAGLDSSFGQCGKIIWEDTTVNIVSLSFADSNHGILIGTGLYIGEPATSMVTSDGGLTWDKYFLGDSLDNGLERVAMIDTNNALAIQRYSARLFKTTDKGMSWNLLHEFSLGHIASFSFSDINHGMVIGSNGEIFHTTDGGINWQPQSTGIYANFTDISYIDSLHAVIVGHVPNDVIFRTRDGGNSWIQQPISFPTRMNEVSFFDTNNGIVIGDLYNISTRIFSTHDGGENWTFQTINLLGIIRDLFPIDKNRWITWGDQRILSTTNGGVVWTLQSKPVDGKVIGYFPSGKILIQGITWFSSWQQSNYLYAISKDNCSPATLLLYPENNETDILLSHTSISPNSLRLRWSFENENIVGSYSVVQVSTDSLFPSAITLNYAVPFGESPNSTSKELINVLSRTTYYWRVAMQYIDGTLSDWSETWKFTTAGGQISGSIFNDLNRDSSLNNYEPGLLNKVISVSGKIQAAALSDSFGRYSLAALDSGTYRVQIINSPPWKRSFPDSNSYTITLRKDEIMSGINFGLYYAWNIIKGAIFHDENENKIRDPGETGVPGLMVYVHGSSQNDSVLTDSLGNYSFSQLGIGSWTVRIIPQHPWEQTYPSFEAGISVNFGVYDLHLFGADFGIHQIPPRVKNRITVHDSSRTRYQSIWWGVRPGATFGIWNVDSLATSIDFSEGESEIPAPFPGGFDARFVNPRLYFEQFGEGSWVDMRNYVSPAQSDTHRIEFSPGYSLGGDYPMTFRWSKVEIYETYTSCHLTADLAEAGVNMALQDSFIVTNPLVSTLYIVTNGPELPSSDHREDEVYLPSAFLLDQNYPNPFNATTTISYSLPAPSHVAVKILDVLGREIATLFFGQQREGIHQLNFDASMLSSGIYFYSLVSEQGTQTKKMLLIR